MEFLQRFFLFIVSCIFSIFCDLDVSINSFKSIDFNNLIDDTASSFNYVDTATEKYGNDEIVARLYINSLEIEMPIVQHSDNQFYLNHDEYKRQNSKGSIFLDYRNNIDIDRKLLIYGHNSQTIDTEFNKLEKFLDSDFFNNKENRKLLLESKNKISQYEITNVLVVVDDFQHMKLNFTDDTWDNHINWINKLSLHKSTLTSDSDILVMQTCYYEPDDSYLLVIAKKNKEEFY